MPTILRDVNGLRLYVRGPLDGSRYFISEKRGEIIRRLQIVEAFAAPLREFTDAIFYKTALEILDYAQKTNNTHYNEYKLEVTEKEKTI